jgi:hypothetical protein
MKLPRTRNSWTERLLIDDAFDAYPIPYLSRQSGEDADVRAQHDDRIPVAEHPLERSAS